MLYDSDMPVSDGMWQGGSAISGYHSDTGADGGNGTNGTKRNIKIRPDGTGICMREVAAPGVYQLKDGMRICDAVEAAGGLTKAASREYWNLAEKLSDGQMIYFPTEEEARERKASAEAAGASVQEESDGRIDINTAYAAQLVTIPGIGETRAAAILAYREKNGPFAKVEDIMQVSGIKSTLFEKMKDYITIR